MGLFTRKAVTAILNDENLTPEERTEQIFALHGRVLDEGYITKNAAQAAQAAAVEAAEEQVRKGFKAPDAKESKEYKELLDQFTAYKTKQEARLAPEYKGVKPKFFDAVYDKIDRKEGAATLEEQLNKIKEDYEEYFIPVKDDEPKPEPKQPQFGDQSKGQMPSGDGGNSFAKYWGYEKRKD